MTWPNGFGTPPKAVRQRTVFEAQWSDCPKDVEDEVIRLWKDCGYGNDCYYYDWTHDEEEIEEYPLIDKYLLDQGVTESCLIRWWW